MKNFKSTYFSNLPTTCMIAFIPNQNKLKNLHKSF